MTNAPVINLTRKKLRTPRAAAIAGILFALLYGSGLVLIRLSIPADIAGGSVWMESNAKTAALGLNLVPYAGIAFLWFIGVIRDRLGDLEDRFFGTVFLGSGLLFLALTYVGSALAGGLLSSYMLTSSIADSVYTFSRTVMFQVINIYALRMSGVFMISLATIWMRTGLMARGWSYITYALALILLLSVSLSAWLTLVFPAWVLVISVFILIENLSAKAEQN